MQKMTLETLRAFRETKKQELAMRDPQNKTVHVIVGMGTCGIAAGAKRTFDAILDELQAAGMTNVLVRQTGCMGLCYSEPTVEVLVPEMPGVVYGHVDADIGRRIVTEHIREHRLIEGSICDKPAVDIIAN